MAQPLPTNIQAFLMFRNASTQQGQLHLLFIAINLAIRIWLETVWLGASIVPGWFGHIIAYRSCVIRHVRMHRRVLRLVMHIQRKGSELPFASAKIIARHGPAAMKSIWRKKTESHVGAWEGASRFWISATFTPDLLSWWLNRAKRLYTRCACTVGCVSP